MFFCKLVGRSPWSAGPPFLTLLWLSIAARSSLNWISVSSLCEAMSAKCSPTRLNQGCNCYIYNCMTESPSRVRKSSSKKRSFSCLYLSPKPNSFSHRFGFEILFSHECAKTLFTFSSSVFIISLIDLECFSRMRSLTSPLFLASRRKTTQKRLSLVAQCAFIQHFRQSELGVLIICEHAQVVCCYHYYQSSRMYTTNGRRRVFLFKFWDNKKGGFCHHRGFFWCVHTYPMKFLMKQ